MNRIDFCSKRRHRILYFKREHMKNNILVNRNEVLSFLTYKNKKDTNETSTISFIYKFSSSFHKMMGVSVLTSLKCSTGNICCNIYTIYKTVQLSNGFFYLRKRYRKNTKMKDCKILWQNSHKTCKNIEFLKFPK